MTENQVCNALAGEFSQILTKLCWILHTNGSSDIVEHEPHTHDYEQSYGPLLL